MSSGTPTLPALAIVYTPPAAEETNVKAHLDTLTAASDAVQADITAVQTDVAAVQTDVAALQADVAALQAGSSSTEFSFTGNGSSTVFAIPGVTSSDPGRTSVIVGGAPQPAAEYTISLVDETITLSEAPYSGMAVFVTVATV